MNRCPLCGLTKSSYHLLYYERKRHPMHINDLAKAGCDIATIPYKVIMQMVDHPLTTAGLDKFMKDWESVPKN
jgi:transaldolase